jgi:hypothetical protein
MMEEKLPNVVNRRCNRSRRVLCDAYKSLIPNIIQACQELQDWVKLENYEMHLELHEVSEPDIIEALSGATVLEIEDQESLRALRAMHLRFSILRRVYLCRLLSLDANGSQKEKKPWRIALQGMNMLIVSTGKYAEKLGPLLEDIDLHNAPSALSPTLRSSPEREKCKKQLAKMAELANDLRTMQTKLFICRDDVSRLIESNASTSNSTVSTQIQSLLNTTVDTIGHDIKSLSSTYEGVRAAIVPHPQMESRRISWNSLYSTTSPLIRSPTNPFGHLSVVSEGGKPLDALRALSGDSSASGGSPIAGSIGSDEEVFEAIGLPRVRRAPRDPNMMEEMNARKERAAQGSHVVRELESVIEGRRKMKRMSTGRIGMAVTSNRISSL